ncbi:MAG: [protein-PII] uridylyltransferase [Legionellales bacterium]|nr:[protein-PII] uridylyltransferase [Legionellales bacterium]
MKKSTNFCELPFALSRDAKRTHVIAFFRQALKQHQQLLADAFSPKSNQSLQLISKHSEFIDHVLDFLWHSTQLNVLSNLCLIAVGGYGRQELFPYSDIDILILSGSALHQPENKLTEFINLLWDIGLKPGHSIRTFTDCIELAKKDVSIFTSLLEARLLQGHEKLFQNLKQTIAEHALWSVSDFFYAKMQEQEQRYIHFHATAYNLEPNIKNSPGGLRDIQMITWIAQYYYPITQLKDLVIPSIFEADDYELLMTAKSVLSKIRFALHCLTQKCEDRLSFDYQKTLAQQFGYGDREHELAIEQFMQNYYRSAKIIRHLNEVFLQFFRETVIHKQQEISEIDNSFHIIDRYIALKNPDILPKKPELLFEIFLHLAKNPSIQGVRAQTIQVLRKKSFLINDEFRQNPLSHHLFLTLLEQPQRVVDQLARMNRYGLLGNYLPYFGEVIGKMQYDLFHAYTVDQHTLFVLKNIEQFLSSSQFPLCHRLMSTLRKRALLFLGALFHDIGKGRGGDHSTLGAMAARSFCEQHQLPEKDTELVEWLVKNHLLMSITAQRRDIYDTNVINEFVKTVNSVEKLNYLYLLTVADIRGTNPQLWNGWKDSLLKELYELSYQHLVRQPRAQVEFIRHKKTAALQLLTPHISNEEIINKLWLALGNNYFLHHQPQEIAWHTQHILNHHSEKPLVIISNTITDDNSTAIFVYCADYDYLFASIVTVLDQAGLTVLEARIITSKNGYSLDSFKVLNRHHHPLVFAHEIQQITQRLVNQLEKREAPAIKKSYRRHHYHFPQKVDIHFLQDHEKNRTIMELFCVDRPGLLAKVSIALVEQGISIQNAKIVTLGERVEDVFYITDRHQQAFTDISAQEKLKNRMIGLLAEI